MKEIDWIIQEQSKLLKSKGYNETKLNSPEIEGSYKLHLKDAVQDILDRDAVSVGNEKIQLRLIGYFGTDKVSFTFQYDFDTTDNSLTLQQVEATLNKISLPVKIENGRDLWKADELFQRVKQLEGALNNHLNKEWNDKIEKLFTGQAHILATKGYANEIKWTEKFQKLLAAHLSQEADKVSFRVILRSHNRPPLESRFHFTFHPPGPILTLNSIFYKHEGMTRIIHYPREKDIPLPAVMIDRLMMDKKIATAKEIAKLPDTGASLKIKR
jgi:hypothetical protein